MMKKQGFTLAEVLITLTIIGVVATMTLPALMTNTQEQQAKTGLKKGINTLTEAAQMHEAIEGFNYASLTDKSMVSKLNESTDGEGANTTVINSVKSLAGMLKERTKVDIAKTIDAASSGGSTIKVGSGNDTVIANEQVIYFNDGTALIFDNTDSQITSYEINESDNLPVGYVVVFDTNGLKGPNQLSNCAGKIAGGKDETKGADNTTQAVDIKTCQDKTKRVIKDQFTLRFRGNMVEPEGAAATWAFGS